jgi:demethylmenaquinone methyltransferase/2-methoxy-6-polyprenyl-1,4-benzoquinol methylase
MPILTGTSTAPDNPHIWPDKADRVRRMFASVAPTYDLLNHLSSAGIDRSWRKRAVELSELPAAALVLDLCTGTADLALAYGNADPTPARVVGSDFCPEMLEIGRNKAAECAPRRRPDLIAADALRLPFADDTFDVVSCAFGLRNLSDIPAGLAECRRVLKPGGCAVVLEFTLPSSRLLRALYQLYFRAVMPLTATLISGDRTGAYRYLPRSVSHWPSPAELEQQFRQAGFVDVDHRLLTCGVAAVHRGRKPGGPSAGRAIPAER